jgi:hypothetical protein
VLGELRHAGEVRAALGEPSLQGERDHVRHPAAAGLPAGQDGRPTGEARPGSPIGAVTVPPWQEGAEAWVLPRAYRDLLEVAADAGRPLRAGEFAAVTVTRCAWRRPGAPNYCPADAALSLPAGRHSHTLAKLAALEAARGSFDAAHAVIARRCGPAIGKRQLEQARRACRRRHPRVLRRPHPGAVHGIGPGLAEPRGTGERSDSPANCNTNPLHTASADRSHAFITAALDAGVSLRDVQEAASHADPRTTMRYDRAD